MAVTNLPLSCVSIHYFGKVVISVETFYENFLLTSVPFATNCQMINYTCSKHSTKLIDIFSLAGLQTVSIVCTTDCNGPLFFHF